MKQARPSPLPFVVDEDEELLLDDQDKALLKKLASDPFFELKGTLGAGSYNCAHLVHDADGNRQVLRVGFLPDFKDDLNTIKHNKMITRGLEMVHAFQSFKSLLGPSLLQEASKYLIIKESELQDYVYGSLCDEMMNGKVAQVRNYQQQQNNEMKMFENHFALQHLEYLAGGMFTYEAQIAAQMAEKNSYLFMTFSLIWFLVMAQKSFSFRHRDLKADNIIMRKINDEQNTKRSKLFAFELRVTPQEVWYFHFESKAVPVIIDFDFATTTETVDIRDKQVMGTSYTAPPDVILRRLCAMHKFEGYRIAQYEQGYDWWSLGICLLESILPNVIMFFRKECVAFAKRVALRLKSPLYEGTLRYAESLFYGYCMASVFSGTSPSVKPPFEWYNGPEEFQITDEDDAMIQANAQYLFLIDWFKEQVQKRAVLATFLPFMLHWEPTRRDLKGDPMQYILLFKRFAEKQPRPGVIYEYQGVREPKIVSLEAYPLLKASVCSSCFVFPKEKQQQQLFLCPCCKHIFCSEECQIKKH
jgi:serine/threonine protein kinase